MLRIPLGSYTLSPDIFIIALLAYFICRFNFIYSQSGKGRIAGIIISVIGLLLSAAEFCLISYTNFRSSSPLSSIYTLVLYGFFIAMFIRALSGRSAEIISKNLLVIVLFIVGIIPAFWLYRIPLSMTHKFMTMNAGSLLLYDVQYLLYAGVLAVLMLTLMKKNNVKIYALGNEKKTIIFSVLALTIVLSTVLGVGVLIMGDVSASLGTPTSLIRTEEMGYSYYSDAYNAVSEDRMYRSVLTKGNMITNPDADSFDYELMEEIKKDSVVAIVSWVVVLLAFIYTLRIQRIGFEEKRSTFPAIISIWMLLLLVYWITELTVILINFIYVPVSFIIVGIFIVLVYMKYKVNRYFSDKPQNEAEEFSSEA